MRRVIVDTPNGDGPERARWRRVEIAECAGGTIEEIGPSGESRDAIRVPDWTPPAVAKHVRRLEKLALPDDQWEVVRRLATDNRMQTVWKSLLRQRQSGDGYYYAATQRAYMDKTWTQEQAQAYALRMVFQFAFEAARDQTTVTKPEEMRAKEQSLVDRIRTLREIADELAPQHPVTSTLGTDVTAAYYITTGSSVNPDVFALDRVADWLEHRLSELRQPNDPLSVANSRGDPITRGVQIRCALNNIKFFGARLDGTAATLAAVALGKDEPSPRASRSALSRSKSAKRS
jgi:hypothetical protein